MTFIEWNDASDAERMKQYFAMQKSLLEANKNWYASNRAIAALEARCRELEAEVNEQARVNGMGGSREARLLARVAEIEAALNTAKVGLRVLAAGGAAGKTDRAYAAEVLEQCSETETGPK